MPCCPSGMQKKNERRIDRRHCKKGGSAASGKRRTENGEERPPFEKKMVFRDGTALAGVGGQEKEPLARRGSLRMTALVILTSGRKTGGDKAVPYGSVCLDKGRTCHLLRMHDDKRREIRFTAEKSSCAAGRKVGKREYFVLSKEASPHLLKEGEGKEGLHRRTNPRRKERNNFYSGGEGDCCYLDGKSGLHAPKKGQR